MLVITSYFFILPELKHALEMLELENKDLQGLKVQHDRKVNELEKTQVAVLEVSIFFYS